MAKLAQRLKDAARSGVYRASDAAPVLEAAATAALHLARIALPSTGKEAILRRIAGALRFPDSFGANWDALEDSLLDLPSPGNVLLFEGAAAPAELLEVLRAAAAFWQGQGVPFFAVFVDPARTLKLPDLYRE